MNELLRTYSLKANYYAFLLAVTKRISAREALFEMGISPENANKEAEEDD